MFIKLLPLILSSQIIFANEAAHGAHHAGPTSLIYPLVNFIIFFAIIYKFVFPPLRSHFSALSEETQIILDRASKKAKESEQQFAEQERKNASIETEIFKINRDLDVQTKELSDQSQKELEAKIIKLENDFNHKVESEKNKMFAGLTQTILEEVVSKTKNKVTSDSAKQQKATDNMTKGFSL